MQADNEVEHREAAEVKVKGEVVTDLPDDLYIPPEALRVFLETFQGPLDLLLYLIKKQNLDVLDIPIAEITRQYMKYVDLMKDFRLELAAEYLVMAALLAEIKSRLLLPKLKKADEDSEEDPRAELVRRLQEYERFKQASLEIDELPRVDRDIYIAEAMAPAMDLSQSHPDVSLPEMLKALQGVLARAELFRKHQIEREPLSVRERMSIVLAAISADEFTPFSALFQVEEGRMGVVVTFIAILELIRQSVLELVQAQPYAPIYIKARG